MTNVRKKSLILLTAIGMACGGCHHGSSWEPSEPEMPLSDPEMLTLNLNVSYDVNGTQATTRASADLNDQDGYEHADGDFEMISSLRVIILREVMITDSKASGTVEANRMVATTDSGYPIRDNLEFKVIANEKKRIYLIANERSITSTPPKTKDTETFATATAFLNSLSIKDRVDLNQLADWTVKNPNPSENDTVQQGLYSDISDGITPRLPLTEWFNISTACDSTNLKNINPDNLYYTHLFITRTAAKATFIVDQENSSPAYDNVKITALTLSGIGSEEYLFPRDTKYSSKGNKGKYPEGENILQMNSAWLRPSSESLRMYITDFATPPASKPLTYLKTGLDIPVVKKNTGDNTKREILGPIYFPESILAPGKQYEVGVQLSTGVWLNAPLETNILNIGGRDAVARNTHLKITLKFTPQELEAEVSVVPYIGIDLNPGFGFDGLLPGDHHQPVDW